jgi:hypothetical protein
MNGRNRADTERKVNRGATIQAGGAWGGSGTLTRIRVP